MKRILVISDSHGKAQRVQKLIRQAGKVDLLLHCGDGAVDAKVDVPLLCVRGNCDYLPGLPDTRLWEEEGCRLFMTHGHIHGVKTSYERLLWAAREKEADIVLFGHTHMPYLERIGPLLVLNPGSLGAGKPSYAILEIDGGCSRANILRL